MNILREFDEFDRRRAELDRRLDIMDSSDDEDVYLEVERRMYKMQERIDMSKWGDEDFIYRFRLSKATVAQVLQMIHPSLVHTQER